MKKFVNDPRQFAPEMLKGIALANPDTQGSGSGHEPAHVMIVGKGMLDAACPGDVFAAPPMDYVLEIGRRGVAGNFFVIKAVGAASEQGADLDELLRIGNKVNSVTRTMGMALTSCTPPAKGSPLFDLGDDDTCSTGTPTRSWLSAGSMSGGTTSATTAPRWTWPVRRSRSAASTRRLRGCSPRLPRSRSGPSDLPGSPVMPGVRSPRPEREPADPGTP
jgi:hypothetical protein